MRKISFLPLLYLFFIADVANSQEFKTWKVTDSSFAAVEGQAWPSEMKEPFDRFPERAQKNVRPAVWQLSTNSAGLIIRFYSDAANIKVRYTVSGERAFPHMPATGVSGLDLYGKDRDGKWFWFPGKYSFGDSITYAFSRLLGTGDTTGRQFEYFLYLPLYNTVTSLEIQYPADKQFIAAGQRRDKPIVVYGTSIAQGGCASRPGLAWPAILGRSMDRPVINLGFSGNGQIDSAVINLMTEVDAKVFIIDCLPNLVDSSEFPDDEINRRLMYAVKTLQSKKPGIPIVLSEHSAGGPNSGINLAAGSAYEHANNVLRTAFKTLQSTGTKNIYLLSNKDIDFKSSATVDGEHPTDAGMEQNAAAYEKLLREALNEPKGSVATTIPVSQSRDAFYFFPKRHQEILDLNKTKKPSTVFIGNSIVHMWGGEPSSSIVNGDSSWNKFFGPLKTVNMGYGWDRVENVIWRVHHDELDGFAPERIIVMIGTNNIGLNTDEEIIEGLKELYSAIRKRQPTSKLYIIGILPRTSTEKRIMLLNRKIASLAKAFNATYADPGKVLLDKAGITDESLFTDGLHPNQAGYRKLEAQFRSILK